MLLLIIQRLEIFQPNGFVPSWLLCHVLSTLPHPPSGSVKVEVWIIWTHTQISLVQAYMLLHVSLHCRHVAFKSKTNVQMTQTGINGTLYWLLKKHPCGQDTDITVLLPGKFFKQLIFFTKQLMNNYHTGVGLFLGKKNKVLKLNYVSGREEHSLLLRLKKLPGIYL